MWIKSSLLLVLMFSLSCTDSLDSQSKEVDLAELIKSCAALGSATDCASSANICYFNQSTANCKAKRALEVSKAVATNDALLALTKDGYLFENPLKGAPMVTVPIKDLSATNDFFCFIDRDDNLSCKGAKNVPIIPPGTKAKQVAIGAKDNLCYRSDADKVLCIGANAANPALGVFTAYNPATAKLANMQMDYSNRSFDSIEAGYDHACGVSNNERLCMSHGMMPASYDDARYLTSINRLLFALGKHATYEFFGSATNGFSTLSSNASANTKKFVAQGTKGVFIDAATLPINEMSVFVDEKNSDTICLLSNNKVYCGAVDPTNTDRIDLSGLKSQKAKSMHLSSEIVCVVDSSHHLNCAHLYGQNNDKRIAGFGDQAP